MANILTASLPSFPPFLPPTLLLLLLGLLSPLPAEHWQFAAIFIQKCFYLFLLGIWQRHLVVQARHPVPVPASLGLGLGLILVVAAWFILMNVRLFVSSVFTDCQRDLLDALQAGQAVTLHIAFVVALAFAHTHTHTVTCTARVLTYCCTYTRAHTCLCRAPEIIAYFTEINRISISCTHAEQPHRHVSRPSSPNLTSPHLTMPVSVPYRTAAYHSVSHCSSALSLSLLCDLCRSFTFSFYILQLGMTLFLCCRTISFIHLPRIVIVLPLRLIPFELFSLISLNQFYQLVFQERDMYKLFIIFVRQLQRRLKTYLISCSYKWSSKLINFSSDLLYLYSDCKKIIPKLLEVFIKCVI